MTKTAQKQKVLITGCAGFIGAHVARHCLALGQEVVGLDDLSGGFLTNIPPQVKFVQGSVTDRNLVTKLFANEKFDLIYHLAAYAAEGLSHFIRRFNYETNLQGSINLINESVNHDIKCFVFTSSIAVYGPGQLPMTEEMKPEPEDPYGISKYAVELDLAAARKMFGLNYIIFRPHNVYGELQNLSDRYRNVIGIFMNQVMAGEAMSVFGDGTQTRAFSHIDDVAPVIARAPAVDVAYNHIFNVGADTPYTINELAEEVAAAFDVPAKIRHLEPRNEVMHAHSSHDKLRKAFGEQPGISLRDGIRRMAAWARERGTMEPTIFDKIEIQKNLPPSWASVIRATL